MIEFKIKDHILRLTKEEWKNLKRRFNPENAVLFGYTYKIKTPCKLCTRCKTKKGSCSGCPFHVIFTGNNACLELIQEIFPAQAFHVTTRHVHWSTSDNYTACRQLNALLRRMKKIEEVQ